MKKLILRLFGKLNKSAKIILTHRAFLRQKGGLRTALLKIIFLILFLFILCPQKVSATEILNIDEQLNMYDFSDLEKLISNEDLNLDFRDLVKKAMSGDLDLSFIQVVKSFLNLLFKEIYLNMALFKNLIIVGILSGIFKNFTDNFKQKEIAQLGFYICYVVFIILLFNSFGLSLNIMVNVVDKTSNLMLSLIPLIIGLLFASGNQVSALTFNPILFLTVNVITRVIKYFVSPILTMTAVIQMINYLSVKETLSKLSEVLKNLISFTLKSIAIIFAAILSLQKLSTPIANNLVVKGVKSTVSVVPVVGGALQSAVDTVLYWSSATKSGFMVGAIIIIILFSAIPMIKLFSVIVIYKITSALIEPVSDEKITECLANMSKLTILIFAATFISVLMYLLNIIISLSI